MSKVAFRVLYREFLFHLVDREVLSAGAQGDASKLLGRFAAILVFLGILFAGAVLEVGDSREPHETVQILAWGVEHSLIATTMLMVGLFAVLSWDSAYPDRRDVFVLGPLPVRANTIFAAKIASIAASLGLAVITFNAASGLLLPFALAPREDTFLDLLVTLDYSRPLVAYWITMFSAGAFILCSVLAVQGIAAQLPRRLFLRLSAFLQMAAFCLFVAGYFLEPSLASPQALMNVENQHLLACLPSYWFLGLFQELNGSMGGPTRSAVAALASRAWIGLSVAVPTTGLVFLLSYFRTLRKIAEQPDISPGSRRLSWLPRFGNLIDTAVTQFAIRSLTRSRQHRVLLSFYAGIGFAIVVLFMKTPVAQKLSASSGGGLWPEVTLSMLASSFIMMCFWILGIRVAFGLPLELQANWIFRVTRIRGDEKYFAARRHAFYVVALGPVLAISAACFFSLWRWRPVVEHLTVLLLLGVSLAELCLYGLRKVPFTCSYLPGKSNLHITFVLCLMLGLNLTYWSAQFERRALSDGRRYTELIAILCIAAAVACWRSFLVDSQEVIRFEEELPPAIASLGLHSNS